MKKRRVREYHHHQRAAFACVGFFLPSGAAAPQPPTPHPPPFLHPMTTPPHPPMLTDYSPLETPRQTLLAMRRDVWRIAGELSHLSNELTRLSLWLDLVAADLEQTDEALIQSQVPLTVTLTPQDDPMTRRKRRPSETPPTAATSARVEALQREMRRLCYCCSNFWPPL